MVKPMDKQFDEVAKSSPEGVSRREALARLGIGVVGMFLVQPAQAGIAKVRATSGKYLLVSSFNTNSVLRYDEATGAFVDKIGKANNGGLRQPGGVIYGPDASIYVADGWEWDQGTGHKDVLRFDGVTGTFIDDFADQNQLYSPRGLLFGADGNLYVADGSPQKPSRGVLRFSGRTGAFIDHFVTPGSGGIDDPNGMVFGPDGDLYVGDVFKNRVMRYDGETGAFKEVYVAPVNALNVIEGITFGPDGNLYVASLGDFFSGGAGPGNVSRFQGPYGANPGAIIDTFVPGGSGGLCNPVGLLFGPGGDLFVTSVVGAPSNQGGVKGFGVVPGTSQVLRYSGQTGAFLGVFVGPDSGGLQFPIFMTFTDTNPTTLNYKP
jgi:sugar lactone lactonase YvrE